MPYGLLRLLGGQARHGFQLTIRPAVQARIALYSHAATVSCCADDEPPVAYRPRHSRQRTKLVDYIANVIHQHERFDLVPLARPQKRNVSKSNLEKTVLKQTRCQNGPNAKMLKKYQPKLGLRRILGIYLEHHLALKDWSAGTDPNFQLTTAESDYLASQELSIEDVAVWAKFITTPKAKEAIRYLVWHESNAGTTPIPLPILLYFLRRQHIPAAQLDEYIEHVRRAFVRTAGASVPQSTAMVAFVRLTRHARKVAPQLLCKITDILLEELRCDSEMSIRLLRERTVILNNALALLAVPASVRPFGSAELQQDAAARILQYMTDHRPALHISRDGYRAVVTIQLRLPKTSQERGWALLKALSWPPWKQDRTAMDSEIRPEHGISKAGQSMQRMAEAGYAPRRLEEVSWIYSGWNTDDTPTIQKRHILPRRIWDHNQASAQWAARIETTRTVQEAWACWSTYEAETPEASIDSNVVLAMLKKLCQHERQTDAYIPASANHDFHDMTLPGDGVEVSPLPASIHQHTYTRTEPPSSYEFFKKLRAAKVRPNHSLASFLVANASGLLHAYEYLQYLDHWWPEASATFTTHSGPLVSVLPPTLLISAAEALCRHSTDPLASVFQGIVWVNAPKSGLLGNVFHNHAVNDQHCLVRAVWLLTQAERKYSSDWHRVYFALSRQGLLERHKKLSTTTNPLFFDERSLFSMLSVLEQKRWLRGFTAVLCYRIAQKVLNVMQTEANVPLDLESFRRLCQITMQCGVACREIVDAPAAGGPFSELCHDTGLFEEAEKIWAERPGRWLAGLYNDMAANTSSVLTDSGTATKLAGGMLIEPVLLWDWIRALGSFGEHEAMLELVRMVCAGRSLIKNRESSSQMRTVRRAITALEVYLGPSERTEDGEIGEMNSVLQSRAPASLNIVEEIRALVEANFEDYAIDGQVWATDEEVEEYLHRHSTARSR